MTTATLGPVSAACRERLTSHYGPEVKLWLDAVPNLLDQAANRWSLHIREYHDAGHAAALAVATSSTGTPVMLKSWFDPRRFRAEMRALRAWHGGPVAEVLHTADDLSIAALAMVTDRPGGCPLPPGDEERVAGGLQQLHELGTDARAEVPQLRRYLRQEIFPRIRYRDQHLGKLLPTACRAAGLAAVAALTPSWNKTVLLHADLYRENIAFDETGRPVFLDPLPMLGDPALDWAFWTVYYDLERDPVCRLRLASAYSDTPEHDLLPWCLTLCFDGLLYYHDIGDRRAPRMAQVMTDLSACGGAV